MSALPEVTPEYCEALWQQVCNWQRWGADDQLGAVNHINTTKRLQAAALVSEGIRIEGSPIARRSFPANS